MCKLVASESILFVGVVNGCLFELVHDGNYDHEQAGAADDDDTHYEPYSWLTCCQPHVDPRISGTVFEVILGQGVEGFA